MPATLRRHRIVSLSLFLASLTLAGYGGEGEVGQPAPRFRARTTTGEQFNNENTKGKVVLFEFWTTWCKYCEEEAELVDNIAKEFKNKNLIVLAVDVLEPDKTVKSYLVEHPRSVPIVLTRDTNLAAMYNAQVYPSLCRCGSRRKYCRRTTRCCRRAGYAQYAQTSRFGI